MAPCSSMYNRRGVAHRTASAASRLKATSKAARSSAYHSLRRLIRRTHRGISTQSPKLNNPEFLTLPRQIRHGKYDEILNTHNHVEIRGTGVRRSAIGVFHFLFQKNPHLQTDINHYVGSVALLQPHVIQSRTFGLVNLKCTVFVIKWRNKKNQRITRRHAAGTVGVDLLKRFEWWQEAMWVAGERQFDINSWLFDRWSAGDLEGDSDGKVVAKYMLMPLVGDETRAFGASRSQLKRESSHAKSEKPVYPLRPEEETVRTVRESTPTHLTILQAMRNCTPEDTKDLVEYMSSGPVIQYTILHLDASYNTVNKANSEACPWLAGADHDAGAAG